MLSLKAKLKIKENQDIKQNKIISSALKLFTEKGVKDTSVSEITNSAGVAKGTFYLYFKDKYELQDYLITRKSKQLFDGAIKKLNKTKIGSSKDKIIFIIDSIISELSRNKLLLKFISKNLSWGVYNDRLSKIINDENIGLQDLFMQLNKNNDMKLTNPEIKLFLIIELVSGSIFSSIIYNYPMDIDRLKPFLYSEIKNILKN